MFGSLLLLLHSSLLSRSQAWPPAAGLSEVSVMMKNPFVWKRIKISTILTLPVIPRPGRHPNRITPFFPHIPQYDRSFILRNRLPLPPPTLFQPSTQKDYTYATSVEPHNTKHLNGMRGMAAFAVFLCHLSYGTFDINHVYGATEPGQTSTNTHLLQLPIVRLFYSGPPMVAIFFVISGYALSYKPMQLMQVRDFESLVKTLSSSVFRRPLRLFLPCFISSLVVACLAQLGIYKLTEEFAYNMRGVHEEHPWTAPNMITQLLDWMHQMIKFINVFDWTIYAGSTGLDPHLWTIPVELRCSMALFLVHILVARMPSRLRVFTFLFLMLWGTYWDRCELVPFLAGALLADLDLRKMGKTMFLDIPDAEENQTMKEVRSFWWKYFCCLVFTTGLFLASYPDLDGHITPGYIALTDSIPSWYTEKHRFWPNVGAIMIVWSASNIHLLQRLFMSRILQWLGKISFPLYIIHGPIIHTFGYFVMDKIWKTMGIHDSDKNLEKGFLLAALSIGIITLWLSTIFYKVVDTRCVRFARWLEYKFFVLWKICIICMKHTDYSPTIPS